MGASGKRRLGRKLIALVISVALALVAGEVLVRLVIGSPLREQLPILEVRANRHRGWEMTGDHYTYHHRVTINSLGLRGRELGPKQPTTRRVLALGDSLTYGQGVGDAETLPAYIEQLLNASGTGAWEVVNSGHRAYDTRQELGLLRELGPRIQPDAVVLFWYWNDFEERDIDSTCARLETSGAIAFDVGAPLQGWEKTKWHAHQLLRRSALVMFLHDVVNSDAQREFDDAFVAGGLQRLDGYLAELQQLAAEWRFKLLMAVVPHPAAVATGHASQAISDAAAARATARGIPVVRLLEPLRGVFAATGKLPVLAYDGHYAPKGNAAMAGAAAAAVRALFE